MNVQRGIGTCASSRFALFVSVIIDGSITSKGTYRLRLPHQASSDRRQWLGKIYQKGLQSEPATHRKLNGEGGNSPCYTIQLTGWLHGLET
ncbi:hypothetical protein L6164_005473 [Bauhinia variegata]|uniref:Uncharacterized protein n=1 Tax=Bauhinia variegata TaxID=167791 RepID=A0ACB9PQQ6_BAUVA|nr:hypothetical protein L6164_005473 [Bauhinia variegata]